MCNLDLPEAPSYPWLLGTTSFVLPAGVEENVRALAGQVDAVQLLFFESRANSRLEHRVDVNLLARLANDNALAYTVHLPLDLELGSRDKVVRRQAVDEVCRLLEELAPLTPRAFDLHLRPAPDVERVAWQAYLAESLQNLAARCGEWRAKIGIENIGYDFALIEEVVRDSGFGICVDFGHRLRYNQQTDFWAFSPWRHIHLHGAEPGRDHLPFQSKDLVFLHALGRALQREEYRGVVTVELYDATQVRDSLAMLHQAWQPFQQGE